MLEAMSLNFSLCMGKLRPRLADWSKARQQVVAEPALKLTSLSLAFFTFFENTRASKHSKMERIPSHLYQDICDRWGLSTAIFRFNSEGRCRVGKWEAGLHSECVYISTSFFAFWLHLTMCYFFTESFISLQDAKNDINIC